MTHKQITIDGKEYNLVPADKDACGLKAIHGGYHPVTGRPIQIADRDLPKIMTYEETEKYIKKNCPGWQLPTIEELHVLYANRKSIGGFNAASGSGLALWYWSCTEYRSASSLVYAVDFTDGLDHWDHKDNFSLSSRVVRAES